MGGQGSIFPSSHSHASMYNPMEVILLTNRHSAVIQLYTHVLHYIPNTVKGLSDGCSCAPGDNTN